MRVVMLGVVLVVLGGCGTLPDVLKEKPDYVVTSSKSPQEYTDCLKYGWSMAGGVAAADVISSPDAYVASATGTVLETVVVVSKTKTPTTAEVHVKSTPNLQAHRQVEVVQQCR